MPVDRTPQLPALRNIATRLRIESVRATATAGSGHPTSCCSAAEIVTALFFAQMRFDPHDPACEDNDRFVLSKGHAAPILYAAWAEASVISRDQLSSLRDIDSDLEGHPTPRLPFVDVATGSLGQGICAAVGTALNARRIGSSYRTYVLLGDGESAEGSVWEAAQTAARAEGSYAAGPAADLFDDTSRLLTPDVIHRIRKGDATLFRFPGMFGAVAPLFPLLES